MPRVTLIRHIDDDRRIFTDGRGWRDELDPTETDVKERIYVDTADRKVTHDEVTVIDHVLTRPWTVMKNYRRSANRRPRWTQENCRENNLIAVGKEDDMLSWDGLLMPTRKDQLPPDLRFSSKRKNDEARIPIGQKP